MPSPQKTRLNVKGLYYACDARHAVSLQSASGIKKIAALKFKAAIFVFIATAYASIFFNSSAVTVFCSPVIMFFKAIVLSVISCSPMIATYGMLWLLA